jgi:peptidoglycan/xylan/chitin deacetylase (PgdA/CDA1 family)
VHQLEDAASRRAAAMEVIRSIKHLPRNQRQAKVDELCEALGTELPSDLMMSRSQVRQLTVAGMEVGAHTVHHPILRTLSDQDARDEIVASREELQSITGTPITGFAYPNGRPVQDFTERDRDLVEALGFDHAVSTVRGCGHAGSDIYQVPRFTPWDRNRTRWLGRLLLEYGNAP